MILFDIPTSAECSYIYQKRLQLLSNLFRPFSCDAAVKNNMRTNTQLTLLLDAG
jgi:hypothetical protein